MVVPMTAKAFRSIVEGTLNDIFEEVYAERSEELDVVPYLKEVDFDEPEQK